MTNTGPSDFCPVLAPLNTQDGQLIWPHANCEVSSGSTERFFDYHSPSTINLGEERIFAVEDWWGWGDPSYTFDIEVTVEP